ncbi:MAG: DUF4159 domain-containing protein [Gemmataceae bacterium]
MLRALIVFLPVLCCFPNSSSAQGKRKPDLADRVKKSIDKGIEYLRKKQRLDGGFERSDDKNLGMRGGWSSLTMLSLINAGVPTDEDMMKKGLEFIRELKPRDNYVLALQTMVLSDAGFAKDKPLIQKNVDLLIKGRTVIRKKLRGWSYSVGFQNRNPDGSNTQYAVLGLLAGRKAGVKIPSSIWDEIRECYASTQAKNGGWEYQPFAPGATGTRTRFTMSVAGTCGLLLSELEANRNRLQPLVNGAARNCGVYKKDKALAKALGHIEENFRFQVPNHTFYNVYGIERVGRLSGLRFFGSHDWYREGCVYLVGKQHADGSWHFGRGRGNYDSFATISTSFALLFLSKGRTPVLISKLVHGTWPRADNDTDWNNNRAAIMNLTQFISKNLFKKQRLAWQNFDIQRAISANDGRVDNDTQYGIAEEMLQSPIVFLSGHKSLVVVPGDPRSQNRLSRVERDILKKYVDNGGFLFAEACCGRKEFDAGFKALLEQMWPDSELVDLGPEHAVWTAYYNLQKARQNNEVKLYGLRVGCKTLLVYSPQTLSYYWEHELTDGAGQLAHRLGANVVAYATGLEAPRPKLTQVEIAVVKQITKTPPRGYLKVAQLRHGGEWAVAPRAMAMLMRHMNSFAGLEVAVNKEDLHIDHEDLPKFKFLYMHGRKPFEFGLADNPRQLDPLRFNLNNGGLLLADACCGSKAFDTSFRKFAKQLFPEQKLEPVPTDDILYSAKLNGTGLTEETIRGRTIAGKLMTKMAPQLEGIKVDNRWVILYSKYDIGCALERKQSTECRGYDHKSALRIGAAAILYMLRP